MPHINFISRIERITHLLLNELLLAFYVAHLIDLSWVKILYR